MHNSIIMTILVPTPFLKMGIILVFFLVLSKDNRWGRSPIVSLLSWWAFETPIFRFFDLPDALQCLNSVVRLARFNCYSRYRSFKFIYKLFICYYVTNLFEVHPIPFIRACFNPCLTRRLDGMDHLSYACQCGPYRGWSARRILLLWSFLTRLVL